MSKVMSVGQCLRFGKSVDPKRELIWPVITRKLIPQIDKLGGSTYGLRTSPWLVDKARTRADRRYANASPMWRFQLIQEIGDALKTVPLGLTEKSNQLNRKRTVVLQQGMNVISRLAEQNSSGEFKFPVYSNN